MTPLSETHDHLPQETKTGPVSQAALTVPALTVLKEGGPDRLGKINKFLDQKTLNYKWISVMNL